MPIDVVCPGCHSRFSVSDKYGGKTGPCPKCKAQITIPAKGEEVVVHEPEKFGPKNSDGVAVLKPISRDEAKLSTVSIIGIVGTVILILFSAVVLRGVEEIPTAVLAIGAIVVAAPVVLAGYTFLRDDELEPYRGLSLALRVGICSLVYAAMWGVFAWVPSVAFHLEQLQVFHVVAFIPIIAALGAVAPFTCLDLDLSNSLLHFGLYVLVTIVLCLIMNVEFLNMAAF